MSEQKPTPPPTHTTPASRSANSLFQTTPFPNRLLDEIMPRLNDTQWRLLCVIVRQTLGWQRSGGSDGDSNTRKQWDWMTRTQLKQRTGRNAEALAAAVDTLTRQGFIVTRSSRGQMLATSQERRQNQSRIYYSLAPEFLQWLRTGNKSHDRQTSSRPISTPRSPCSKIEHRQIEHGEQRKTEHGATGKSNTTKQTQTKEKNTKRKQSDFCNDRSFAPTHTLHATTRQAFGKSPATEPEVNVPAADALTAASPQVRDFIRLFEELYARQKQVQPQIAFSAADWQRLHILLQRHPNLNWQPVLKNFLESDIGYVTRHHHSLLAFLNLCNFFLLHIPDACGTDKASRNATRKESGWQRTIAPHCAVNDKPNRPL